ncbi:MAG: hypothetical protein JXE07_07495 [Candidatus Aminicenantes bacterium]|nr:hypothetical protein [Candidatus Aminicenantes bacterium]
MLQSKAVNGLILHLSPAVLKPQLWAYFHDREGRSLVRAVVNDRRYIEGGNIEAGHPIEFFLSPPFLYSEDTNFNSEIPNVTLSPALSPQRLCRNVIAKERND